MFAVVSALDASLTLNSWQPSSFRRAEKAFDPGWLDHHSAYVTLTRMARDRRIVPPTRSHHQQDVETVTDPGINPLPRAIAVLS